MTMRVAKASPQDIDASFDLMGVLDAVSKGYYPTAKGDDGSNSPMHFDDDDPAHLKHFFNLVRASLDSAPGWQGRVIFGFATIQDPRNNILHPDADHIALHPMLVRSPGPVYQAGLKTKERMKRDIPPDQWGWYVDVAGSQKIMVRDATAADLKRCTLKPEHPQDPAAWLCEVCKGGSLIDRRAVQELIQLDGILAAPVDAP